jgi:short-subunit dehydrogenase
MDLSGRSALLTGATGGLGRAIAAALAGRGAKLILSGRKAEALEELAAELPGEGHRVLPADLAEAGAAEKLAAEAGVVDVLVANAGLPGTGRLPDYSVEQLTGTLRVNLEAPILLARALEPAMLERGSGHMVFISSLSGKAPSPLSSVYNATKFGLRGFALGLRADLDPQGIGVSIVSPGTIREAGMYSDSGAPPIKGLGTGSPQQVADAVVRAIEKNKVEIAVAPPQQRFLAHFALASPSSAVKAASGDAGQKAAAVVAEGQKNKR